MFISSCLPAVHKLFKKKRQRKQQPHIHIDQNSIYDLIYIIRIAATVFRHGIYRIIRRIRVCMLKCSIFWESKPTKIVFQQLFFCYRTNIITVSLFNANVLPIFRFQLYLAAVSFTGTIAMLIMQTVDTTHCDEVRLMMLHINRLASPATTTSQPGHRTNNMHPYIYCGIACADLLFFCRFVLMYMLRWIDRSYIVAFRYVPLVSITK